MYITLFKKVTFLFQDYYKFLRSFIVFINLKLSSHALSERIKFARQKHHGELNDKNELRSCEYYIVLFIKNKLLFVFFFADCLKNHHPFMRHMRSCALTMNNAEQYYYSFFNLRI